MSTDEVIINGLVSRRGTEAARQYALQTLQVYRRAVLNPAHFASTLPYRRSFIMSYLFYKHYLQNPSVPPSGGGGNPTTSSLPSAKVSSRHIEDCEHRMDEELAASMPCSDAPSWTLGGSVISQRRHPHHGP
jgi:hypothetical protein